MKHQLKEDIRDQYIYGILKDSGERIMPTLDAPQYNLQEKSYQKNG